MGVKTGIEWADSTWNPWRGCTKVSAGCANCYAETLSRQNPDVLGRWGRGEPRVLAKNWLEPAKWDRKHAAERAGIARDFSGLSRPPRRLRVFPSLCDWLDDEVPVRWLAQFLGLIRRTPNLDWLLLTKRPGDFHQRLLQALHYCQDTLPLDPKEEIWPSVAPFIRAWLDCHFPDNVWIGTSVENDEWAEKRIPLLREIPAAVRFLSIEPILGPVNLPYACFDGAEAVGRMEGINWVIIGGESGPGARPTRVEWFRTIIEDCRKADVACYVKQLGKMTGDWELGKACPDVLWRKMITHPKGGDPTEWPDDLWVRQMPE